MEVDPPYVNRDCGGDSGPLATLGVVSTEVTAAHFETHARVATSSATGLEPPATQNLPTARYIEPPFRNPPLSEEGDVRHAKDSLNDKNTSESGIPPPRSSSLSLLHRNQLSNSVMRKLGTAVLAPTASNKEYRRTNLVDSDQKMSHDVAGSTALCDDNIEAQAEGRAKKKRMIDEEVIEEEAEAATAHVLASEAVGGVVARSAVAVTRATATAATAPTRSEIDVSPLPVDPPPRKSLEAQLRETEDICQLAYRGSFRPEGIEFNEEEDGSLAFDLGALPNREEIVRTFVTGLVEKKSDRWAVTHFDPAGRPVTAVSTALYGGGPVVPSTPGSCLPSATVGTSASSHHPASSASGFAPGTNNDPTSRPPTTAINRSDLPPATVPLDLSKLKTFVSVRRRETDASQRTFYSIRTRTCSIAHAIFVGGFDQILALASKNVIPLHKTSHFTAGVRALKERVRDVSLEEVGVTRLDESTLWLCLHIKNAKEPAQLRPHLDEKEIPVRLFHLPYSHYYALSFEYAVYASETKLANVGGREVCLQLDVLASTNGLSSRSTHQSSSAGCEVMIDVQLSGLKKQTEERAAALAGSVDEEQFDYLPNSSLRGNGSGSKLPKPPKAGKRKQPTQQRRVEAHVHGRRFANKGTQSMDPETRAQLLCELNSAPLPSFSPASAASGTLPASSRRSIVFVSTGASPLAANTGSKPPRAVAVASATVPAVGLVGSAGGPTFSTPRTPGRTSHSSHAPSPHITHTSSSSSAHHRRAPAELPVSPNLAQAPNASNRSHASTDPSFAHQQLGEPKRRLQESRTRPMEPETRDGSHFGSVLTAASPSSAYPQNSSSTAHPALPLAFPPMSAANPMLFNTNSHLMPNMGLNPEMAQLLQLSTMANMPVMIQPFQLNPNQAAAYRAYLEMHNPAIQTTTPLMNSSSSTQSHPASLASSSASWPLGFSSHGSLANSNADLNSALLAGMNPSLTRFPDTSSTATQHASLSHNLITSPLSANPYMSSISPSPMAPNHLPSFGQVPLWPSLALTPEQYATLAAQNAFANPYAYSAFQGYRN